MVFFDSLYLCDTLATSSLFLSFAFYGSHLFLRLLKNIVITGSERTKKKDFATIDISFQLLLSDNFSLFLLFFFGIDTRSGKDVLEFMNEFPFHFMGAFPPFVFFIYQAINIP